MKTMQQLRAERAEVAEKIRTLMADRDGSDGKPWRPEDQAAYDAGMADLERVEGEQKRLSEYLERVAQNSVDTSLAESFERRLTGGPAPDSAKDQARALFARWLRRGDDALNAAEWQAIRATMSTTTDGEGGYLVPEQVASTIIDALKAYGGMRAVATVLPTMVGGTMNFPTSDGTSEEGEIVAENGSASDADIDFGVKSVPVYKYSSKVVAVPFELLQDSSADVEAFVRQRLATRLGRITNRHFTTGSGSSQPNGIVTASSLGKTGASGQTATVIYDDFIDLYHSVDPAYRESGNLRWMMADSTLKVARKLKDDQERPIFVPGYDLNGAMPDTLLGVRIAINQHMPVMAASAKSILFGDFAPYMIRDVMMMSLFRFTDSAYTKKGQVGFLAWMRSGGNLVDVGGAVKHYANAAS